MRVYYVQRKTADGGLEYFVEAGVKPVGKERTPDQWSCCFWNALFYADKGWSDDVAARHGAEVVAYEATELVESCYAD